MRYFFECDNNKNPYSFSVIERGIKNCISGKITAYPLLQTNVIFFAHLLFNFRTIYFEIVFDAYFFFIIDGRIIIGI